MKQNNSMKRKLKEDNAMSETSNSSLLFSTCEEVLTKDASSNTVSSKKTLGNKNSKTTKNRLLSEPAHIREVPVDNNDLALAFESFPYCNAALNNYIRTYLEQKGKNDAKIELEFKNFRKWISSASVDDIHELFEVLLFILDDKKDVTQISTIIAESIGTLLNSKSYILRDVYLRDIPSLLPIILKLGNIIDFSHLPYFSARPEAPIFGTNIGNSKVDAFTIPLEDEHILTIIDTLLLHEEVALAGEWIHRIMTHDLVSSIKNPLSKPRSALISIITESLRTDSKYRDALKKYLIDDNINEYILLIFHSKNVKGQVMQYEQDDIDKTKISTVLEEKNTALQAENTSLHIRLSELLAEQKNSQVLSEQLLLLREKYDNQCAATEDVERAKQLSVAQAHNRIEELSDELDKMYSLSDSMQTRIVEMTTRCENLTADLANTRTQLEMSNSESNSIKTRLSEEIKSDLVYALKDQINHLGKALSYFSITQEYDEATLEICFDAFGELLSALTKIGASPIGRIGEITTFDPALHHASEKIISEARVKIVNLGWTVAQNVISKADVERVVEE